VIRPLPCWRENSCVFHYLDCQIRKSSFVMVITAALPSASYNSYVAAVCSCIRN
jgi:hypothetical protein